MIYGIAVLVVFVVAALMLLGCIVFLTGIALHEAWKAIRR